MDDKQVRKFLRRQFRPLTWSLVGYYGIMNILVILTVALESLRFNLEALSSGNFSPDPDALMQAATQNAWGYLLSIAVGLVILLAWKGSDFFREEIFQKNKSMKPLDFLMVLCVFLGCQVGVSFYASILEALLNLFVLSAMAALESATVQADTFSMFLYASIAAPIAEELLFRGFLQRSFQPYGKKFSVFAAALLFGLFHGNLVQTPYAFLVGLVLGYVTVEYSILWAIVLHMVNNLVLADLIPRLLSSLPQMAQDILLSLVIWAFAIAGIVILIVKRREVKAYLSAEWMDRRCLWAFFTGSGFVILVILMLINMLAMVTPV